MELESFVKDALLNQVGYDPVRGHPGVYTGWRGHITSPKGSMSASKFMGPITRGMANETRGILSSSLGPLGLAASLYMGYQDEGVWGATKWLGAELVASGFMATAMAGGLSGEVYAAAAGGAVGSFMGPGGYALGTAIGATAGWTGLVPATVMAGGVALYAGTAYLAAKGSYELLKAGYGHRQKMLRKIDTAGSTAAFLTKNAYTMRAKAVEAIRTNQLQVKSALGQEAQRVHFSAYRRFSGPRMY